MCHVPLDRMYGHVLPAALIPRPHISLLCPSPLPVQLSGLGHLRDPFPFLSCPAARIAGLGHLSDPFLLAGVEQTVAMLDQRLEAQVRVVDGGSMKPHLYPA